MANRVCKRCGVSKKLTPDNYRPHSDAIGFRHKCRKCETLDSQEHQIQWKYGITLADYDVMLEEQGGCCAICGTDNPSARSGKVRFAVDHCHKTGKVRGLLCESCNIGLGNFYDNKSYLQNAINYLGDQSD